MRQLNYVFGSIAVLALLIAGSVYYRPKLNQISSTVLGSDFKVQKLDARAFGSFALQTEQVTRTQSGGGNGYVGVSMAESNSASGIAQSYPPVVYGMGGGGGVSVDAKMIVPPDYTQFVFKYDGDTIELPGEHSDVLRRVKGTAAAAETSGILNQINFGLLDLNSFGSMELQNFNVSENKSYGYSVFVNLLEGDISISQNWMKWPNPYQECKDQSCYDKLQLNVSDLPSDDDAMATASAFLEEHQIDRAKYATPQVQSDWKIYYAQQERANPVGMRPWVPDSVNVIYPLLINGKNVYDEGGAISGMMVSISVRENKVSGLYQLQSQVYQSSSYGVEQNLSRIVAYAERGGRWGAPYPVDQQVKTVEIALDTPTLQWVRVWNTSNNQPDELVVPALVFPVRQAPDDYYGQRNIVVPVIKEILDSQDTLITIMPMGGATEGVKSAQ